MKPKISNRFKLLSTALAALLLVAAVIHFHHRHENSVKGEIQAACHVCEVAQHTKTFGLVANTPHLLYLLPITSLEFPPKPRVDSQSFSNIQARAPPASLQNSL